MVEISQNDRYFHKDLHMFLHSDWLIMLQHIYPAIHKVRSWLLYALGLGQCHPRPRVGSVVENSVALDSLLLSWTLECPFSHLMCSHFCVAPVLFSSLNACYNLRMDFNEMWYFGVYEKLSSYFKLSRTLVLATALHKSIFLV